MYVGSLPQVSNRASWQFLFQVVDDETDDLVDVSTLSFVLEVRDPLTCSVVLSASTANGKIASPSTGELLASFTRDDMAALCSRTYEVGVTAADTDDTAQFIIGTLPVLDGIVSK